MSVKAVEWAFGQGHVRGSDKAILLALAWRADDSGAPFYDYLHSELADLAGWSNRTLFTSLRNLEAMGLIKRDVKPKQHKPARYLLLMPDSDSQNSPVCDDPDSRNLPVCDDPESPRVANNVAQTGKSRTLYKDVKPKKKNRQRDSHARGLHDSDLAQARLKAIPLYLAKRVWNASVLGPTPTYEDLEEYKARAPPGSANEDPAGLD